MRTNTTITHPVYRHRAAQALNNLRHKDALTIPVKWWGLNTYQINYISGQRLGIRKAVVEMCRLESELDDAQDAVIASALARRVEAEQGKAKPRALSHVLIESDAKHAKAYEVNNDGATFAVFISTSGTLEGNLEEVRRKVKWEYRKRIRQGMEVRELIR